MEVTIVVEGVCLPLLPRGEVTEEERGGAACCGCSRGRPREAMKEAKTANAWPTCPCPCPDSSPEEDDDDDDDDDDDGAVVVVVGACSYGLGDNRPRDEGEIVPYRGLPPL